MSDKKSSFGFNVVSIDPGSSQNESHENCKGCGYSCGTSGCGNIGCNRCSAPCSRGCNQSCEGAAINKALDASKGSLFHWGNDAEKPSFFTKDSDSSTEDSTETMKPF